MSMSLTRASRLLQHQLKRVQSVPAAFYHENVSRSFWRINGLYNNIIIHNQFNLYYIFKLIENALPFFY